jgi:hypothetical protein
MKERDRVRGQNVAIVLTGANIDPGPFAQAVAGAVNSEVTEATKNSS